MRTKLGIFGILGVLLGVALLVFGIAKSVSDGAHSEVDASAKATESGYIWTEAGVLDLVNTKVHVQVKAADKEASVTVAIGKSPDVEAWTQGLASVSVSGLDDWDKLATTVHKAETDETPALAGGDLWIEEKTDKGGVEFDYEVTKPGATSIIAWSSEEGATPELGLSWKRPEGGSMGLPIAVIGALVAAIGLLLILMGLRNAKALKPADDALGSELAESPAEASAAFPATQKLDAVATEADSSAVPEANEAGDADSESMAEAEKADVTDEARPDDAAEAPALADGATASFDAASGPEAPTMRTGRHGKVSLFARNNDSNGNEN